MATTLRGSPFETSGITVGADGIKRYDGLPASLVELLRRRVDERPGTEAVVEYGGERLSHRQLWDQAARVAGGLREGGVRRGDRVACRLPNGNDWVLAFFGAQLAGAVFVPVNTRFTAAEASYVMEDSGASFVFEPGQALPAGLPIAEESAGPDDVAAIFYTSGTTGFPKGAMTTHANFLSNCETARRVGGITLEEGPSLRTLVSVPLFHVTGCNSQLLAMLWLGGTTVILPQFEVQAFLRAAQEERISALTSVPAVFWLALNQPNFADFDLSSVQRLSYGGAPIAPDLVRRLMGTFPGVRVGNGFGLTETSSIATFLPHEWAAEHADSVGFAAPVCDLEVPEPDVKGGAGELLIRGPNVVAGYWNKPEATAQTFVNGWLHTGDVARINSDGLIYIVDRAKDMINRGGEKVYSVEVENVLAAAPGVYEVAVVGVPDAMMGEKVGAVIVPMPNAGFDAGVVLTYAREHLADFKVPQFVAVRTQPLPRNAGGKILKPTLRSETEWERTRA